MFCIKGKAQKSICYFYPSDVLDIWNIEGNDEFVIVRRTCMSTLNHTKEDFHMKPSPVWHFFQTPHTVGIDQDVFYAWSNNAAHGSPSGRAHSRYLKKLKQSLWQPNLKYHTKFREVLCIVEFTIQLLFLLCLCFAFFLILVKHCVHFSVLTAVLVKETRDAIKAYYWHIFSSHIFVTWGLPLLIAGLKM